MYRFILHEPGFRPRAGRRVAAVLAGLAGLLFLTPGDCAAAQGVSRPTLPVPSRDGLLGTPKAGAAPGRRVVVSLEEHRLYVVEGERILWSARIGTGTGERLAGAGREWEFSTPRGEFQVQLKERDPVWHLPDWVFVERGEPIPPLDSPKRRAVGQLGAAALYLSPEIAIHGTDHPEQLGAAVSHGCIRVSNQDVRRLYDELEVGTPVVIR